MKTMKNEGLGISGASLTQWQGVGTFSHHNMDSREFSIFVVWREGGLQYIDRDMRRCQD